MMNKKDTYVVDFAYRSEVGEGGGESVFDLERYIGRGLN